MTTLFQIDYKIVDLASFNSIKSFVDEYKSSHIKLDILINNAGVFSPPVTFTEQGIEATTGINYLGHFYLTYLLMDLLMSERAAKGRVVVVASDAYRRAEITLDMLDGLKPILFQPVANSGGIQYGRSNVCRILFAKELAKRYPDVTSVSLHPGAVATSITRSGGCFLNCMASCFAPCIKSPAEGAETSIHCATADLGSFNGMYFKNSKQEPLVDRLVSDELQERLWDVSLAVVERYSKSLREFSD